MTRTKSLKQKIKDIGYLHFGWAAFDITFKKDLSYMGDDCLGLTRTSERELDRHGAVLLEVLQTDGIPAGIELDRGGVFRRGVDTPVVDQGCTVTPMVDPEANAVVTCRVERPVARLLDLDEAGPTFGVEIVWGYARTGRGIWPIGVAKIDFGVDPRADKLFEIRVVVVVAQQSGSAGQKRRGHPTKHLSRLQLLETR